MLHFASFVCLELYRAVGIDLSPDRTNPGLVLEGTRCGTDMMCISQECRDVSTLNFPSCPIGSNGLVCSGITNGVSCLRSQLIHCTVT